MPLATPSPISAKQGGNYQAIDWYGWRYVKGNIDIRLTDVTPDYGVTFSVAQILFTLFDRNGINRGSHWVNKQWGVMGAWTRVGAMPYPGGDVRLRVTHGFQVPVEWTAEMRYDNVQFS